MSELTGRDIRQISQTVLVRLDKGLKGAPASFTEAEKKYYKEFEKQVLDDRKAASRRTGVLFLCPF